MSVKARMLCFAAAALYTLTSARDDGMSADEHLRMGNSFLAKSQFPEALQHYHSAVDLEPDNYQILYRRATVLLASGKVNAALSDLNQVVILKPDFISGRMQRANILMKQGKFIDAEKDYEFVLNHDSNHEEAKTNLRTLTMLRDMVEEINDQFDNDNFASAEQLLDQAIEHCKWYAELYRKRAKCRVSRGDLQSAIADIRAVAKLVPDSTESYMEISEMYYSVGDVENALVQIRECLKLNPEHKTCFPYYKRVKKLAKMREAIENTVKEENWEQCLSKGQEILKFEKDVDNIQLDVFRYTCKCNLKLNHVAEAIQECTEVLTNFDANNLDVLLDRGEAYILSEEYDKAIDDFQKATSAHESSKRAQEALKRAQKLKKQASRRDYYKELGVKRNASKKEIMKAYRKLAQKWHPDNFHNEDEKSKAQERFIRIANAKDVLTDPEKKKMYDSGVDPLDPEAQQHGHRGFGDMPFGEAFRGFHFGSGGGGDSGGYTFKFHYS